MRSLPLAAFLLLWAGGLAVAETPYPDRAVTVVVPFAAGGGSDTIFRAVAEELRSILGKPFIVENRKGADGILGLTAVHAAAPDGYTLLAGNINSNGSTPMIDKDKIAFDVDEAFDIVSPLADGPPTILVASKAELPVRDIGELVTLVRENPRKIRFGSAGMGSSTLLDIAKLARQKDLKFVHVPSVGGGGQLLSDLVSGDLHISFVNAATVAPLIRSGDLIGLALVGDHRLEDLDVPTFAEQGYPDIGTLLWHALFAPAKTPEAIKQKLFVAVQEALKRPRVQALMKQSYYIPVQVGTRAEARIWREGAQARIRDLIAHTPVSDLE